MGQIMSNQWELYITLCCKIYYPKWFKIQSSNPRKIFVSFDLVFILVNFACDSLAMSAMCWCFLLTMVLVVASRQDRVLPRHSFGCFGVFWTLKLFTPSIPPPHVFQACKTASCWWLARGLSYMRAGWLWYTPRIRISDWELQSPKTGGMKTLGTDVNVNVIGLPFNLFFKIDLNI